MFENLAGLLSGLWNGMGLSGRWPEYLNSFLSLLIFIFIVLVASRVSSALFIRVVEKLVNRTWETWGDGLRESRFFLRLSRLVPVVTAYMLIPEFVKSGGLVEEYLRRIVLAALALVAAHICATFCDSVNIIYRKSAAETAKRKPIKGAVQFVKVCLYIVGGILAVTTLVNVSPLGILSGLGAMSAVLLLIFKDSILGFISGIQLSGNDMVRIGDWIEMPTYNADGNVIDITLQSVKVQNWDNTISSIPIYALVSDSFKNWRGMSDSGGRRIKRSIYLDQNSVHFLTDAETEKLSRIKLIEDYMRQKLAEASAYNREHGIAETDAASGERLTNLGTFRAYAEAYVQNLPARAKDMTCMVRYLQPDQNGLQMEFYLFSSDKVWVNYEHIQADIIDHLLATLSDFGLRVFQTPSGGDIRFLAEKMSGRPAASGLDWKTT